MTRKEYLAHLAKCYLENMIDRMNSKHGDENEVMEYLKAQAGGDFAEVVLSEE